MKKKVSIIATIFIILIVLSSVVSVYGNYFLPDIDLHKKFSIIPINSIGDGEIAIGWPVIFYKKAESLISFGDHDFLYYNFSVVFLGICSLISFFDLLYKRKKRGSSSVLENKGKRSLFIKLVEQKTKMLLVCIFIVAGICFIVPHVLLKSMSQLRSFAWLIEGEKRVISKPLIVVDSDVDEMLIPDISEEDSASPSFPEIQYTPITFTAGGEVGHVWGAIEKELDKYRLMEGYGEFQRTQTIDAVKDELVAWSPEKLKNIGILSGNISLVYPGERIDLSSVIVSKEYLFASPLEVIPVE